MAAPAVVEVPQLQQLDAAQVQAWAQQMNAEIAQMRADRELLEDLDQIMMQAPAPTVIPGLLTEDDELEMGLSQLTLAPAQALAFVNAEAPQRFFRPSFDEDMD